MAAPTIVRVYPADNDTGIPVGETLLVYFDRGVDLKTVNESIVLFGNDFDQTSGPDSALWIDGDTGRNPFFLTSPGFQGPAPLKFELAYWDTTDTVTYAEVTTGDVTSETQEVANNWGHVVKITLDPEFNSVLAADTQYTLQINGDVDTNGTGVSSRTVFDVVADGGNTGSGDTAVYGTYDGLTDDTLNIQITDAGDIGTAKYKWWFTSAGEPSAVIDRVTNRRFRNLDSGLQIRFTGSSLAVGDTWTVNAETISRMSTSTTVTFTTNDGSYTAAPSSPSTPASSSPPSSVLPTNATPFGVVSMTPHNASYNVDVNNREITIVFSENVDPATITDATVVLHKYPVEGSHDYSWDPVELEKSLSVSGDTLSIRF